MIPGGKTPADLLLALADRMAAPSAALMLQAAAAVEMGKTADNEEVPDGTR